VNTEPKAARALTRTCDGCAPQGVHEDDHYGDINLVSGIPFPRLAAQPKWVRFRLLNAAVTRPWLLSLKDQNGMEVSSKICQVRAGAVLV
jgi:FtsP/CotA-like multicopper oxidase with cupredoxin domain